MGMFGFSSLSGPNAASGVFVFLAHIAQNANCCHIIFVWDFMSVQYATEMYPPHRRRLLGNHKLREIQNW